MPVVTAGEVVALTNTSKTESEIENSDIIALVQDRINSITNNWFTTELQVQDALTFNATDRTVIAQSQDFAAENFVAADEIYIYGSYRNDGYYTVNSVATSTLTLITGASVVDELSGQTILVSVVQWPRGLKLVAAQMVKYETDDRPERAGDITSRSLGPFSESYARGSLDNEFGYPTSIINQLSDYRIARLM